MARNRFGRNTDTDTPTEESTVETLFVEPTEAVEAQPETVETGETSAVASDGSAPVEGVTKRRAPRPAINVGNPIVRPSTRTDFTTRATPTETNPVFVAAKNAPIGTPTDILVEPDKVEGAISILRRAGAKLNLGMHIAPKPYLTEEIEGVTYSVITFKTSQERQVRGKQSDVAADESAASE